jgi:hypothetical protein
MGGKDNLHAALASLPTLQHLRINDVAMATWDEYGSCTFEPKMLHHLPNPTCLEISSMDIGWDIDPRDPLTAVQLTELQALRSSMGPCSVEAKTMQHALALACMPQLSYLHLDDIGHQLLGVSQPSHA